VAIAKAEAQVTKIWYAVEHFYSHISEMILWGTTLNS